MTTDKSRTDALTRESIEAIARKYAGAYFSGLLFQDADSFARFSDDLILAASPSSQPAAVPVALAHAELDRLNAAVRTLDAKGYTYTDGAELWRPPLGKQPEWLADNSRADALTDVPRDSIEYAIQVFRQVEAGDGTFVGQCTDAISGLESILAAYPVEQHAAALAGMPSAIWWVDHGTHGQITTRPDEAERAREAGSSVHKYHAAAQPEHPAADKWAAFEISADDWKVIDHTARVAYDADRFDGRVMVRTSKSLERHIAHATAEFFRSRASSSNEAGADGAMGKKAAPSDAFWRHYARTNVLHALRWIQPASPAHLILTTLNEHLDQPEHPAQAVEPVAIEIIGATAALRECVDAAEAWRIISDAEDADDIDPVERTMAANRRVAAFESARTLLSRRTSSSAGSPAVSPTDDARECLMAVVSHHDDFEKACRALKDAASDDGNASVASYWLDRIDVLGRMKTHAERALTAMAQPIPAPTDSAGAEFESWIATLLGVGQGEQFRDRICTAIKTLKVRAIYATETCVEGVRPVPPRWYSRDEIVHALKNMNYRDTIALELADWFVRHLQLAFNKGFEKGARTPVQAAPVANPADWTLVPGDPVHQQLTAICQSYWGDGWDDEDMREARLVDAREMYKAAINAAPQPRVTSPSAEG